jgi:hypothetical protein
MRWHRAGFYRYWRWKLRNLGGWPKIAPDLRASIRRMSIENRLWGAPRIHGELLKLRFAVAQSMVAMYMAGNGGSSGQSGGPDMPQIAAVDLFVVPTVSFNLSGWPERELVWINVTAYPTAEWIAE